MRPMPKTRWLILSLVTSVFVPFSAVAEKGSGAGPDEPKISTSRPARAAVRQEIRLEAGSFDPLTEQKGAVLKPESLRALEGRAKEHRYGIVQFTPREAPSARKELAERGVRFFGPIPDSAFLIRLDEAAREILQEHPAVRWVGVWEPGFKVHPSIWPGSKDQSPEITVVFFPGESAEKGGRLLESRVPGVIRLATSNDKDTPRIRFGVPHSIRDAFVEAAALDPGVAWIQPYREPRLHNFESSGPIQGNAAGDAGRTVFKMGLTGTGQIVAVSDSGCDSDMCFFRQLNGVDEITDASATTPPALGPVFPNRKVLGYWIQPGATAYDNNQGCSGPPVPFHGTHVSASVLGDNPSPASSPTDPGVNTGDGMAPNAQLLFIDIGNDSNGCLSGLGDYGATLEQVANGGARIFSNSWGGSSDGSYGSDERVVDRFLFDDERLSVFFSAGNEGSAEGSIGSPAAAKNVVTVGALESGMSTAVAFFSSRGPAKDGRIKPDLMAPGSAIVSAAGDTNHTSQNCNTRALSGTSMSCPIAAGGAALLRQYFSDGFYPSGERNAADRWEISAVALKAVLLNGTLPIISTGRGFGNPHTGWGRVFLDNNLYFRGDARGLRVFSVANAQGLQTGEKSTFSVDVVEGQEFRATLVWADPEGTLGAAAALVNNLDLSVTAPDGTVFLGNVLGPDGVSTSGGTADQINNVEQVRFTAPVAGVYTLTVHGARVPGTGRTYTDRQGFGLAVSMGACSTSVAQAPSALSAASDPKMGAVLTFTPASGSAATQVYRASGPCEAPGPRSLVGETSRGTFTDSRAQGGFPYSYWVRGRDGCGEGPISDCVGITPTGKCDLQPRFAGLASVVPDAQTCRLKVTWSPATGMCPLANPVIRYNVYRGTRPGFTPTFDDLIATVTGTTEFVDTTVSFASGTTYFYVVRAEELAGFGSGPSLGNEDPNLVSGFGTALGPPSVAGDFVDDGGDTRAALLPEWPWYVSTAQSVSGRASYHAGSVNGTYPATTCAALTTPSLVVGKNSVLSYRARYNLEDEWDGVVVEISTDGGSTWVDLPPESGIGYPGRLAQTGNPPANQCGYPASRGAFTGPTDNTALTSWEPFSSSLTKYEGKTVRIRWRLTTDPGLEYTGFFLDDVKVTNVTSPGTCVPAAPGSLPSTGTGQTGVQKK
ncbi:MAG: hypothetical protein DIJKHBIC_04419 [Thermoanaerobaculia bacterium]|nr:hypothetical protein [Thermoanaerobaculia bacterium]